MFRNKDKNYITNVDIRKILLTCKIPKTESRSYNLQNRNNIQYTI